MSENIPKSEAVAEVRKACTQFSDLYFHVARVLYEHFGELKAKELLGEAVANRAVERGKRLAAKAESLSLEKNAENFFQVTDIPFLGWDPLWKICLSVCGELVCALRGKPLVQGVCAHVLRH